MSGLFTLLTTALMLIFLEHLGYYRTVMSCSGIRQTKNTCQAETPWPCHFFLGLGQTTFASAVPAWKQRRHWLVSCLLRHLGLLFRAFFCKIIIFFLLVFSVGVARLGLSFLTLSHRPLSQGHDLTDSGGKLEWTWWWMTARTLSQLPIIHSKWTGWSEGTKPIRGL